MNRTPNNKKRNDFYGEYHVPYRVRADKLMLKIPEKIRKNLAERGNFVLVGVGNHVEVYFPNIWEEENKEKAEFLTGELFDVLQKL